MDLALQLNSYLNDYFCKEILILQIQSYLGTGSEVTRTSNKPQSYVNKCTHNTCYVLAINFVHL